MYLLGKVNIRYEDDQSYIEANFIQNIMHGKIRILDHNNELLGVGSYENGLPNGPFWFYAPFSNQYILANFEKGVILKQNIALINAKNKSVKIGKLLNETWIENTFDLDEIQISEYNCIKSIKMDYNAKRDGETLELPLK